MRQGIFEIYTCQVEKESINTFDKYDDFHNRESKDIFELS
jgi:hypothetical protein